MIAVGFAALVVAGPWLVRRSTHDGPATVASAAPNDITDITTFTVTLATDAPDARPGDGACATADGGCAIRAAVQEANARPAAGPYRLVVPSGAYTLSIPGDSEDAAVRGDVDIRASLELRGDGAGRTVIHGPNEPLDHAFEVFPPAVVTFRGLTIRDSAGGGIKNRRGQVAITDSSIRENRAHFGGGIANDGVMTITFSTVVSNTAGQGGGIVHFGNGRLTMVRTTVRGNGNAQGGGLKVHGALNMVECTVIDNLGGHGGGLNLAGAETKLIRDTTIARNLAGGHVEPPWHGYGGGIWSQADDVRLINVTLSDNWGQGGGIFNLGRITMTNSTLAFNGTYSWGAAISNLGVLWLVNSVIGPSPQGAACDASRVRLTSGGHNIDSDGTCMLFEPTDLQSVDPRVGPLADNGGRTWTHALLPGSPAIDAGDDDLAPPLDQRGGRRPAGAASDIGAFEYGAMPGAATSRIHLPLVARAVDRRDLPRAVEAPPTALATATATSNSAPSPTVPTEPTPTGPPPSPTMRACAGRSLPERVVITRSPVDNPLRASDEYFPLPVAPRADGGALVAWREQRSATVRVGTFGAADVPPVLSFPAEEVHALVAHDDGGGALAVVDGDPDIYSPKYCRGASTPEKALCGKMDVWRFDAAGKTVWRRTVTGKTNVDRDGAEFVWWYQHTARLVWTGDAYGLYYRNASSSPRPGVAGEIDIHAADAFRVLSPQGDVLTHAWRWGCSHSWAVRLAFNGAFGTACHGDGYPNAFHVVVADRTAQKGEAMLQENVDPTKRALGGLVADDDGFWLLYQAPDRGPSGGSPGSGTMRLHLARIDNAGVVASDDVVAAATNLPTQYPFRPYLAAYAGDRLLAGWHSGGQLQLAVLDGRTGDLVDGPVGVDAQIDAWNEFVAFPNGDVGWAYAADRAVTIDSVHVSGCR